MWTDNPPVVTTFTINTHDWHQWPAILNESESIGTGEFHLKGSPTILTKLLISRSLGLSAYGCPEAQPHTGKIWILLINAWSNVGTKIWRKRNLIRGAYGQNRPYFGILRSGVWREFPGPWPTLIWMVRRRRGKWMRCCWGVHVWRLCELLLVWTVLNVCGISSSALVRFQWK